MLRYVIILSSFLGITSIPTSISMNYPKLLESKVRHHITVDNSLFILSYAIKDETGKPTYWLHCFSGNDDVLNKISNESKINFVGPFACRLSESNEFYSEATLLTENPDFSYWHSRAAFSLNSIEKGCGKGTEYGRKRSFRLRGMEITFEIDDIQRNGELVWFDFITSVKNDTSANSENAESVKGKPSFWINGQCS